MFTKILKNKKIITLIFLFSLLLNIVNVVSVFAAPDIGMNYVENIDLSNSNTDPRDIIINIIKYLMTFLGIIAVCIILYGGFIWMTAAGNEDKIAKAKQIIIAGSIGLVIILAAFIIVQFVMRVSNQALNGKNITG